MNAITLTSIKQLDKPKGPHREEDEGFLKDKGKEIVEEKGDLVPESKEQDKHEETTRPWLVEPYKPLIPFPQRLAKTKLEAKFG